MNKLDVLLINLPVSLWYKKELAMSSSMPPLGTLYIGTVLNMNNLKTKVIDMAVENMTSSELKEYLLKYKPKIIGLSTYCETWNSQKILSKFIRELLPDTIIISGGAFSTFNYEEMLLKSIVDYVVLGEGEFSTLELCKCLINNRSENLSKIQGLAYSKNGMVVANKKLCRIKSLDELPIPDRELVKLEKYTIPFTISTSRGCPGDCIFCSSKAFWGQKVYMRSASSIFKEIVHIYEKHGSNQFLIADDTFTASRTRAIEVCNLIINSQINFIWGCESRADVIDENIIKKLNEAGCRKIQFGLESADDDILRKLKKHVTIKQIEEAVRIAFKYDMHITLSFIIGHAFDTEESIKKTLKFARYLREEYGAFLAVSVNTPFPGTEQYEESEKYGIKILTDDWNKFHLHNAIISTNNLSSNEIRYFYQQAIKLTTNRELSKEVEI